MSEIKVGEYLRTRFGLIGKIIDKYKGVQRDTIYKIDIPMDNGEMQFDYTNVFKFEIYKTSPNIIDLIEVGDFVNKQEVVNVEGFDKNGDDKEALGIIDTDGDYAYGVFLEDIRIRTIVTHEQMEEMEYRV